MAPPRTSKAEPEDESSSTSRSTSPESMEQSDSDRKPEDSTSSSSESEESSGSESESVTSIPEKKVKISHTASSNGSIYPTVAYKPPSGFKAVKKQLPPSSTTSSLLSDLRGKQLFHITAPASLPLSKVKEVSLAKILQGEPVLKHEGVQYGIPPENIGQGDLNGKNLLVYDSKTQTYHSAPATNIPTYHVQEMINIPTRSEMDNAVLAAAQDLVKPPRKQPKHLKMRFRPVGSGNAPPESLGSSSEESDGEEKASKASKGSKKGREERKRKHDHEEVDAAHSGGLPRKKTKKQTDSAEALASSQMDIDEKAGQEKSKKSSKKRDEKKRKKSEKS
ncbi:DNA-directed RNA polymerase I subunit RPA34 [Aspergillus clavatus NRRL 1]|uniref:DNA-directed RNA polymerase I subunit RPA34.5 n=1 Tax=Aspergillus clavatus (strain ATCC 1007 / CBS 513.65 / DSM 816 / NCTC 3887 / NRRL 1 / QM 1276 / 107) TaxID=344612 RepID=A1CFB4_ASPCL|nr:uncharacterized protein ACLA_092610 [Aspergillus clavatus NRRL 1]EAW11563.1 conserved hypothetical protein [Aspergillus clavatus NRRL 1]